MLVTSIFSFSHNVFYPSQNKFQFLSHIYLSSANASSSDRSKILSFGKEFMLTVLKPSQPFTKQSQVLTTLKQKSFVNNAGKGENTCNKHFLLLPHSFLLCKGQFLPFNLLTANAFN